MTNCSQTSLLVNFASISSAVYSDRGEVPTVRIQWYSRGFPHTPRLCEWGELVQFFYLFIRFSISWTEKNRYVCGQLLYVCFKPGLSVKLIIEWLLSRHFYLGQSEEGLKSLSTIDFSPLPHFRYYSSLPIHVMCVWIGSRGKSQRQW